jgi:4'-phosphopantetheinyl transferase
MTARSVEVWEIDLAAPVAQVDELFAHLDDAEQAAAAARSGDHRRRYVVAHGAVREVLARYANVAPRAVEYSYECAVCGGPHGKPALVGEACVFSLTHSADLALLAIAGEGAVGVDVERVDVRPHLESLARRVLSAQEHAAWRARDEEERLRAFLEHWTAKEAYLKALGVGLTRALREVSISEPFTAHALELATGADLYVGALVLDGPAVVERRRWAPGTVP